MYLVFLPFDLDRFVHCFRGYVFVVVFLRPGSGSGLTVRSEVRGVVGHFPLAPVLGSFSIFAPKCVVLWCCAIPIPATSRLVPDLRLHLNQKTTCSTTTTWASGFWLFSASPTLFFFRSLASSASSNYFFTGVYSMGAFPIPRHRLLRGRLRSPTDSIFTWGVPDPWLSPPPISHNFCGASPIPDLFFSDVSFTTPPINIHHQIYNGAFPIPGFPPPSIRSISSTILRQFLGRSRSPVFFRRPLIPVIFAWDFTNDQPTERHFVCLLTNSSPPYAQHNH